MTDVKASADFSSLIKELKKVAKEWTKVAKAQAVATKEVGNVVKRFDTQEKVLKSLNKSMSKLTTQMGKYNTLQAKTKAQATASAQATDKQKVAVAALNKELSKQVQTTAKMVTGKFSQEQLFRTRATNTEAQNFKKQIGLLKELQTRTKTSHEETKKIWQEVNAGEATAYQGNLRKIRDQLLNVKNARDKLGQTHRKYAQQELKDFDKQAAVFVKQSRIIDKRTNPALKRMAKNVKEITVSWRSFTRLLAVQLFHQAVSSMVRQIRDAVSAVIELEKKISEVQTISQNQPLIFERWRDSLRSVSDAWGLDLLDQVEGTYQAISNQIAEGTEAIEFMNDANRFAVTSVSSVADSVNLLTAALNAFNRPANEANEAAAQFFKTIELGRVRASEMANVYGRIAVPAAKLGVKMTELNAIVAAASIQGIKYATTATFIRNVLTKLIRPTEAMKDFFKELGYESSQTIIAGKGLIGFFGALQNKVQGNVVELGRLMGRQRATTGALTILGQGLENANEAFAEIERSAESYGEKVEIVMGNVGKKLEVEINKIKNFFTVDITGKALRKVFEFLGEDFSLFTAVIKGLADALQIFLVPAIGATVLALGSLVGLGGISGTVIATLGVLATAVSIHKRKQWEKEEAFERKMQNFRNNIDKIQLRAIDKAYNEKIKKIEKAHSFEINKIGILRAYTHKQLKTYEPVYKSFISNIGRFEDTILGTIRQKLQGIRTEARRLQSIIDETEDPQQDLYDFIIERQLSGRDTPGGPKEFTAKRKYDFLLQQLHIAEEKARSAALRVSDEDFKFWIDKVKQHMQQVIGFSDRFQDETGDRIVFGGQFYEHWIQREQDLRNLIKQRAKEELGFISQKEKAQTNLIEYVKNQTKKILDTTTTAFFKIDDPEKLKQVFSEQSKAFGKLQGIAKQIGVDFFNQFQLVTARGQLEEYYKLKLIDIERAARQSQIEFIKKRETEELNVSRNIWKQYVKDARTAYGEVRALALLGEGVQFNQQAERFASGGSSYDRVPAWLNKKEFVMNEKATKGFYSQIVAMNSGNRFSSGGPTYQVGDISVYPQASSTGRLDVVGFGKELRREIRRGRVKL